MAQVSYMASQALAALLQNADAQGLKFAQLTSEGRLVVGRDPLNPVSWIDFLHEQILPISNGRQEDQPVVQPEQLRRKLSRQSGRYLLDFQGETIVCGSLKELLSQGLQRLEQCSRGTLDKLSKVKPRTKRIVARDPSVLFDQPKLVNDYAEKLVDGWWFGTNNSKDETVAWLKRGCELAGIVWDKDMQAIFE
jgi:hypothetical protein